MCLVALTWAVQAVPLEQLPLHPYLLHRIDAQHVQMTALDVNSKPVPVAMTRAV